MSIKKTFSILFSCLLWNSSIAAPAPLPPPVDGFDLNRYLGVWHEIARYPNRFERDLNNVTAIYTLRQDGKITVVNQGIRRGQKVQSTGTAKIAGKSDKGLLKISFQWPFSGHYRIIRLAPDYTHAVVTGSSRKYLWILSRTPEIAPQKLAEIIRFLDQTGFDTLRLEYTQHR